MRMLIIDDVSIDLEQFDVDVVSVAQRVDKDERVVLDIDDELVRVVTELFGGAEARHSAQIETLELSRAATLHVLAERGIAANLVGAFVEHVQALA